MSKIKHILSVIYYAICGAVCFQFTHFLCDGWENIYTLSYYHHQIGSMIYYPLFRFRSWNNGMRCRSFYILILLGLTLIHVSKRWSVFTYKFRDIKRMAVDYVHIHVSRIWNTVIQQYTMQTKTHVGNQLYRYRHKWVIIILILIVKCATLVDFNSTSIEYEHSCQLYAWHAIK